MILWSYGIVLFAARTDRLNSAIRIQRIRQPSRRHYQQSMLHYHLKLFLVDVLLTFFIRKNAGKIKNVKKRKKRDKNKKRKKRFLHLCM